MFAENAEAEVLDPLKLVVKEQEALTNTYMAKVKEMQKLVRTATDQLTKARTRYLKALREAEESLFACEECHAKSPAEQAGLEKLNARMATALREHREAEDAYKLAAQELVASKERYRVTLSSVIEIMEKHEAKRIDIIKESLQKLFGYEETANRVHEQDTKRAVATLEEVNAETDIRSLLHSQAQTVPATSPSPPVAVELKKSTWDRLFELYGVYYYNREASMDYITMIEETQRFIMQTEDMEYRAFFNGYNDFMHKALSESGKVPPDAVEKCRTALKDPKARVAFVHALAECIETHKSSVMTAEGVAMVEGVLRDFVDSVLMLCETNRDTQRESMRSCTSAQDWPDN